MDPWTDDFFQPRAEPSSLFGNDVGHLPERRTALSAEKGIPMRLIRGCLVKVQCDLADLEEVSCP